MLNPRAPLIHRIPSPQTQPTREDLLTSHNIRRPVQSMTAIINGTAAFRGFVDGAEELPFASSHFGTSGRGTGWVIKEEANYEVVAFVYEEATEFVEPEGSVDAFGLCGD